MEDTASLDVLDGHLWRLAEQVADRAKAKSMAGRVVTLKLKRANHSALTRRISLHSPTQLADVIYRQSRALLDQVGAQGPYRLLGCGISDLVPESQADSSGDLLFVLACVIGGLLCDLILICFEARHQTLFIWKLTTGSLCHKCRGIWEPKLLRYTQKHN